MTKLVSFSLSALLLCGLVALQATNNISIAEPQRLPVSVTLVQEGEKPAEDPQELLRIQDACFQRMEYLIAAINHSNDVIEVQGMTLTQLIAKKDVLLMKLAAYKNVIRDAGSSTSRARGTEIRILDNLLQETNWTRDLIE